MKIETDTNGIIKESEVMAKLKEKLIASQFQANS